MIDYPALSDNLCVIVLSGIETLGQGDPQKGYAAVLAAIFCAGVLQVLLGLFKAGKLSSFFPIPAIHGMLAAIGVIIMAKQAHTLFGVTPHAKETFEVISEIPHSVLNLNPEITIVGVCCLDTGEHYILPLMLYH
ncbi:MAG: SulP family inorganic anion transporter [Candidatus Sericytochromatia bacterium]|nr:SulP family inorganic anion transporter [Candidatus Sericytochromatia bacterium]